LLSLINWLELDNKLIFYYYMEQSADTRKIKLLTFGRLNPGTPGHLSLIQAMIDQAIDYTNTGAGNPEIFFTLSKTQGGADNPFECEETDPDEIQITKKQLFVKMISAMVENNYRDRSFIINEKIYNGEGAQPPIIIHVDCSPGIFQTIGRITDGDRKNMMVHLFFGSDQADFATTIETQLTQPKKGDPIPTVKSIVERATVEGDIDIKTLPVGKICEIVSTTPYPQLGALCSSSMVKKLVKDGSEEACAAINSIYDPFLDKCTIDQMRTQLYDILTASEPIKSSKSKIKVEKPKVFKAKPISPKADVIGVEPRKTRATRGKKDVSGGKRTRRRKRNHKKRRITRRRKL
jgi:hypothetical protein